MTLPHSRAFPLKEYQLVYLCCESMSSFTNEQKINTYNVANIKMDVN